MEWKDISNLLTTATRLFHDNHLHKKAIAEAVLENLKVTIPEKDISLKNGIAYINTEPLIKGEIFLKKGDLIVSINKKNPSARVIDIK